MNFLFHVRTEIVQPFFRGFGKPNTQRFFVHEHHARIEFFVPKKIRNHHASQGVVDLDVARNIPVVGVARTATTHVLERHVAAFMQQHERKAEVGQVVQKFGGERNAHAIGPGRIVAQAIHHFFFAPANDPKCRLASDTRQGRDQRPQGAGIFPRRGL